MREKREVTHGFLDDLQPEEMDLNEMRETLTGLSTCHAALAEMIKLREARAQVPCSFSMAEFRVLLRKRAEEYWTQVQEYEDTGLGMEDAVKAVHKDKEKQYEQDREVVQKQYEKDKRHACYG